MMELNFYQLFDDILIHFLTIIHSIGFLTAKYKLNKVFKANK